MNKSIFIPSGTIRSSTTKKFDSKKLEALFIIILKKVIKFLGKLLGSSIILFILGDLFPNLRNEIPNFYEFVDTILLAFDWFYEKVMVVISAVF